MVRRIVPEQCVGIIIDVQEFFLSQAVGRPPNDIKINVGNFARLLGYFRIPVVVTLERPVDAKGGLPDEINAHLDASAKIFEKDFFDLTREEAIIHHLAGLKRKQAIVAGCETDVCILQSCLGLLDLGCEVYAVEEVIFSSSPNVDSAVARMKSEGAVFLTYKSLYYELFAAVDGSGHTQEVPARLGTVPDDVPGSAAH
jgi:nicotinamidase-related amidase